MSLHHLLVSIGFSRKITWYDIRAMDRDFEQSVSRNKKYIYRISAITSKFFIFKSELRVLFGLYNGEFGSHGELLNRF